MQRSESAEFSLETVQDAWILAGGYDPDDFDDGDEIPGIAYCECEREWHENHQGGPCDKELKWANRGRDRLDGWEANHRVRVEDGGGPELENCEIVCWECHRQMMNEE